MTTAGEQLETLAEILGKQETVPLEHADRLCEMLRRAPDEALELIYRRRVKFCWAIARRILQERKEDGHTEIPG